MGRCDYCKTNNEKLISIDFNDIELHRDDKLKKGIEYLLDSHFCEDCVNQFIDRVGYDIRPTDQRFRRRLLQGKLGELILESLLNNHSYATYPYGYENILKNVGCNLIGNETPNAMRLRSSPDLVVNDRFSNHIEFVEIKTTIQKPEKYHIDLDTFERYQDHWGNSILVVIETKNFSIHALRVKEIVSIKTKNHAYINFNENFNPVNEYFERITDSDLAEFISDSKHVFGFYGGVNHS